mgnify:CR=1 FL=1
MYRPGDRLHLSALVRQAGWLAPDPLPLELAVIKPDGQELCRETVLTDAEGRWLADPEIPAHGMTGAYRALCRLPGSKESLGSVTVRVEDFLPRTLRMTLDAPAEPLPSALPLSIKAKVEHLFGDPARGLASRCRVRYNAAPFAPQGWDGFRFGDARRKSGTARSEEESKILDERGEACFSVTMPEIESPAAVCAATPGATSRRAACRSRVASECARVTADAGAGSPCGDPAW